MELEYPLDAEVALGAVVDLHKSGFRTKAASPKFVSSSEEVVRRDEKM